MVSLLDFEPDSSKVFYRNYLAFITKPIPCPRDWGFHSFKDLSIYIVPCIPSITNGDSVLGAWFNSKRASNCCEFQGEGKVCVKSV